MAEVSQKYDERLIALSSNKKAMKGFWEKAFKDHYSKKIGLLNEIIKALRMASNDLTSAKDHLSKVTGKNGLYVSFAKDINFITNYRKIMVEYFKENGFGHLLKLKTNDLEPDFKTVFSQIPEKYQDKFMKLVKKSKKNDKDCKKLAEYSIKLEKQLNEFGWYFAAWCHLLPLMLTSHAPENWKLNGVKGPLTDLARIKKDHTLKQILEHYGLITTGKYDNSLLVFNQIFDQRGDVKGGEYHKVLENSFNYFIALFNDFKALIEEQIGLKRSIRIKKHSKLGKVFKVVLGLISLIFLSIVGFYVGLAVYQLAILKFGATLAGFAAIGITICIAGISAGSIKPIASFSCATFLGNLAMKLFQK